MKTTLKFFRNNAFHEEIVKEKLEMLRRSVDTDALVSMETEMCYYIATKEVDIELAISGYGWFLILLMVIQPIQVDFTN